MVLHNVALIVPSTVTFYPLEDSVASSVQTGESSTDSGSPKEEDYTTFNARRIQQHSRSQSLTFNPSVTNLTTARAPPSIAKTPGATTNFDDLFKPQKYEIALSTGPLIRNKSATSLQALGAAEYQTKAWGKVDEVIQPKSLAISPPSQSIFDDSATAKATFVNAEETLTSAPSKTKIARRRTKEIEYTPNNYLVTPTTLGNSGLFAAINAVAARDGPQDHFWIGTPGMPTDGLPAEVKDSITELFINDYDTFLVWLQDTDMNSHYENYCKNILWPILHSQVPDVPKSKAYQDNSWKHYKKVNQDFADAVIKNYKDGDVVWIHDYHLMLVPQLVREKYPGAQIGLYMHCAFPPSEIFRNLPSRLELIAGMLGANMIGFQTENFRYQFLQTCSRLLNIEATEHGLVLENGRFIDVFDIPMGIDIETLNLRRQLPEVKDNMKELSERFAGKHVLVSRDKLDSVHGIKHKLRGFAEFLHRYPKWEDKVVLVQIATSTPQDDKLRDTINSLIVEINGDWGDLNYQPIVYLNQDIDYLQYLALLSVADGMLVTSLSEGMNLTCHEFVVCQDSANSLKGHAPLIVSEFIGASKVFGNNAIQVNPWHPKGIAEALDTALSMPASQRQQRWEKMFELTEKYCAKNWFDTFTDQLEHAWKEHNARDPAHVPRLQIRDLRQKYNEGERRLLLLDFEGTLTVWDSPKESVITVPLRVISCLNDLLEDPKNAIYVMSQHAMDGLEHMFRQVSRIGLVAENGAFLRQHGSQEWVQLASFDTSTWREGVMGILHHYTTSIPGATVREFKSGMMFDYFEASDQKDASAKAGDLANQINEVCENLGVSATPVERGLYVSPNTINKTLATKAIEKVMFHNPDSPSPDFLFVAGDSYEDECVFEWAHQLRDNGMCNKVITSVVGKRSTAASTSITQGTSGVLSALEKLSLSRDKTAP